MRYFADYIKGKPYEKVVLWENPAPTSNFSDQTITLSDNMKNYDEIEVIYRTSTSLADNLSIKMLMSEFVKTAFETTVGVGRLPALSQPATNQIFTRLIARVSDTSIRITNAFRVNTQSSSSAYCIPLKIIGIKKGLGEVNPPVAEKFTFSIGTTETVITLPHAPKSIVALYNTSSSYPKAGTCMYDVVNEIFLKSSGTGVWTKFEVDGDKLTLLGDNSTSNWTYDCIVV